MDLAFSSDDRAFRLEVRAWLAENTPERAPPMDSLELRDFELEWQRRQYDGGWAGIAWPGEFGGRGLSPVQQMIWYEEYAAAGAPRVGCLVVALNHGGPTLIACASEAQKEFHLPRILRGELVWCQGFSEPNAGSDLAGIRTKGAVDNDHIVVTGQKIWTSYGNVADYQELLIRTDPDAQRHRGLSWLICDMRTPGIDIRPIRTMAGHDHFCEVFYDEVRIPLENVVGGLNNGWSVAMSTLGFERGTGYVGHLHRLAQTIETLVDTARERGVLTEDMAMSLSLARAEAAALRALAYAGLSRTEAAPGPEGSIIALAYGELHQKVYRLAMDILAEDILDPDRAEGGWAHQYLDSFRQTIAGGTSEIRRNIIGERVLGLPKG